MPLVLEARSWSHGVFLGASLSSETTAAAKGEIGKLRHDPFAMLPFCGYNMGDYFSHWLAMGKRQAHLPRIYAVNWFRKNGKGEFLWPGYGDNARVLKWIFERTDGEGKADETPVGFLPSKGALDLLNLHVDLDALYSIDRKLWLEETEELARYFQIFGEKFPKELQHELGALRQRLGS